MTTQPDTPAVSFDDWLASYGGGTLNDKLSDTEAAGTGINPFWTA